MVKRVMGALVVAAMLAGTVVRPVVEASAAGGPDGRTAAEWSLIQYYGDEALSFAEDLLVSGGLGVACYFFSLGAGLGLSPAVGIMVGFACNYGLNA